MIFRGRDGRLYIALYNDESWGWEVCTYGVFIQDWISRYIGGTVIVCDVAAKGEVIRVIIYPDGPNWKVACPLCGKTITSMLKSTIMGKLCQHMDLDRGNA